MERGFGLRRYRIVAVGRDFWAFRRRRCELGGELAFGGGESDSG